MHNFYRMATVSVTPEILVKILFQHLNEASQTQLEVVMSSLHVRIVIQNLETIAILFTFQCIVCTHRTKVSNKFAELETINPHS